MRMELDDNFALCSDRYCVCITKKRLSEKGKSAGQIVYDVYDGYHKNIEDCFESFFSLQQSLAHTKRRGENREEDLADAKAIKAIEEDIKIQDLIRTIKETKKQIREWCKVLDKDIRLIRTDEDRAL